MRLLDRLEKVQKGSQSFDDSRVVFERCLEKCSFESLFHPETTNDEERKGDLVQFLSTPFEDFQQMIKLN